MSFAPRLSVRRTKASSINVGISAWTENAMLADETPEVHVIMNNCFSDHAVVNAAQTRALLDELPARHRM